MGQRTRANNLTVCFYKKEIDVHFSCICPVIDNEFHHNIVKVVRGSTQQIASCIHSYFDESHDQEQDRRIKSCGQFDNLS